MTDSAKLLPPAAGFLLIRAKRFGRISGILFLLALASIVDSVQFMIRTPFNSIQIVAGKNVSITGVLPQESSSAGEMIFFLKGARAYDVSFSPTAAYRGFWLGGDMWRGTLSAKPNADTGEIILTIVDLVPANRVKKEGETSAVEQENTILVQNPGLVYSIQVWGTQKEANRASLSFITRLTGLRAPVLAIFSFLLALGASVFLFLTMRKAESRLALEKTFIVHGARVLPHGLAVFFTIPRGLLLSTDETPAASLLRTDGLPMAEGTFIEIAKGKGTALFTDKTLPPRYGWLITLHSG